MNNEARRVSETLGTGQHVDAPFGGVAKDVHAPCHDEIEQLRLERDKWFHLARRLYNQYGKRGSEVLAEAYLLKEYEQAVEF